MQKDKNIPVQSRKNCITILGTDPHIAGRIKFNALSGRKNVDGVLPWNKAQGLREWTNIDSEYLLYYMETYYCIGSEKRIMSALEMIADVNKFNPFIDMLNSVKWDGVPRIENLLKDYLGVRKTEYTAECMRLLMLAAISRAFSPGTKFDYILILMGLQGLGKSTFFRKLCCNDEWYLENLRSIANGKEAAEQIQGKIIVEMNELLAARGCIESVKAFITTTADDYRAAYARESEKRHRTCVFVGTTNNAQYLTDRTGNRRFLPIQCGEVPIRKSLFGNDEKLQCEFKQAWAEAYNIYKTGKFSLVLPIEMQEYAKKMQAEAMEDDPLTGIIQKWLDDHNDLEYVCNKMLCDEVLHIDNPDRKLLNDLADIMQNVVAGWERKGMRTFEKYGRQKCYKRIRDFYEQEKLELPFGT